MKIGPWAFGDTAQEHLAKMRTMGEKIIIDVFLGQNCILLNPLSSKLNIDKNIKK